MPDGDGATFPQGQQLHAWDPEVHAPFVSLINPKSGGQKGQPILEVCANTPKFKDCCFHIVEVAKHDKVMDMFRMRLNEAKELAIVKRAAKFRPRLICGGGDGTASFALLLVFRALLADNSVDGRRDRGNGFCWTDEEMERYFPALVQMPLGTGNDLGGILGWGRKYPGHLHAVYCGAERAKRARATKLLDWFDLALRVSTPVVNFDVWGFMPPPGQDMMDVKVCELARVEHEQRHKKYVMKPADNVVPFLVLLYSSYGFSANVVARFQLVRHDSRIANLMEYAKIAPSVLFGSSCPQLRTNMEGMCIRNLPNEAPEMNGTDQYFPPRETRPSKKYREVGFLNINSYSGGTINGADRQPCSGRWCRCGTGRRTAAFGDGKADFYRQSVVRTAAKTGTRLQTDKKRGGTFEFEAVQGKGVFMQYDGEGRFVFHPQGQQWRMDVQQVLRIPMVVAPTYAPPGASSSDVKFEITGETATDVDRIKARIFRWVAGGLVQELNATYDEIKDAGFPCISPEEHTVSNRKIEVDDEPAYENAKEVLNEREAAWPGKPVDFDQIMVEENQPRIMLKRPVVQRVDQATGLTTTSL